MPTSIRKRDGQTVQPFSIDKIERAISGAWEEVHGGPPSGGTVQNIAAAVAAVLSSDVVDVEAVQDAVEVTLMRQGCFDVAKAFILYRQHRAEARALRGRRPDGRAISDYIHVSKYARFQAELGRRETYAETCNRVALMHINRFPDLSGDIIEAFGAVRRQEVLPSMRSMQFAGPPIEQNNCKLYNCSFGLVDRLEAFSEAMFLLLCGCGVGYSVQFEHADRLPPIGYVDPKQVRHHVVADSIEGWADALKELLRSYQDGTYLEISYHLVRPAGAPLRTSGGRAPGHLKLKDSLERIRTILSAAQGRQLRPIECHRIMCHAADTALSGGIRRSAMIALFSPGDSEMMNCKTGSWYNQDPWFANANNSVALRRGETKRAQLARIVSMTKQWGEPGFYFTDNVDHGTNPCGEIGLNPVLIINEDTKARLARRDIQVHIGDRYTGWAFCNLCEINAAKLTSLEDFMAAAKAATLIGTLQASYTTMPYLGWVSETIAAREALLGIGMTGMLDSPEVSLNPHYQRLVASRCKEWNLEYAEKIGIRPAARITCVKPSGTASLELGGVASGHHAHHARRYIRRVTADELEFVFGEFRKINPHMCVRKPDGKWVIEFPVQAPDGAIVKSDLTAVRFLDMVKSTQRNWVMTGTNYDDYSKGLHHNVSNTIHVHPTEWEAVVEYLWENREWLTGVAMLAASGDKDYAFAPCEEIVSEADELRWNHLIAGYKPVDYSTLREAEDVTDLKAEAACVGGVCQVT